MDIFALFTLGLACSTTTFLFIYFLFIKKQKSFRDSGESMEKSILSEKLKNKEDKIIKMTAEKATLEESLRGKSIRIEEYKKENEMTLKNLDEAKGDLSDSKADNREKEARLKAETEKLDELKKQFEEYKRKQEMTLRSLNETQNELANIKADNREKEAYLETERKKLDELKQHFESQKTELKNEFKIVSEKIIKERQKNLKEQNEENLGALIKPLQEQIESFKKRINEVHTETVKGNTSLEGEIKKVMDMGIKMRDEANNLALALKGDSQKRGAWGEAQLERTLEMSGLIQGEHYEKQASFKDEKGNRKQTDYLIKLPDNKHIVIDSKVSLVGYDRALSAKDEKEYLVSMNDYVKSVKKHIDDLTSKDYTNISNMNSPSFVLMFMPVEPAYIEALKHDKTLFGYGYDKNIILLSHTTLIPILRTISNLWIMDKSKREASEISKKAGDIYNSVCTLADRFQKLGYTLNTANNHYNEVVKALAGRQGLQGKVERFREISNKANKEMPQIEPRHLQHETNLLENRNQKETGL